MREPPGPEFDPLFWQELGPERAEQLLADPPFPVYGVIEPRLEDGAVAGTTTFSGALERIELVWGGCAPRRPKGRR
jgi:hypothetical protein